MESADRDEGIDVDGDIMEEETTTIPTKDGDDDVHVSLEPAAAPSLETNDNMEVEPESNAIAEDSKQEEAEQDAAAAAAGDEDSSDEHDDGHELSEYERLRLERIQRNQAYLQQLGLEKIKPDKPKARPKKKEQQEPLVKSRFSSRAIKKTVSYAEPSLSVAALVRQQKENKEAKAASKPQEQQETASSKEPKPVKEKKVRKEKHRSIRMERTVYDEFQRINKHKKQVLKYMERDVRQAEKEVKFWTKRADMLERKEHRKLEAASRLQQAEQERLLLAGFSKRELLQEVDGRMEEIVALADKYDDEFEAEERVRERQIQRVEIEAKNKTLDALDRFPKALQDSHTLLSTLLLQRLPKDPPPPRRSRRTSTDADAMEGDAESKKKDRSKVDDPTSPEKPSSQQDWPDVPSTVQDSSMPEGEQASQEEQEKEAAQPTTRIRTRNVRNVGGWVSPNMAKSIDRSWLERDAPVVATAFDVSTYAPQVGEAILYYPCGHKKYLETYPDVLGKKLRSAQRVPLWERPSQTGEGEEGAMDESKKWWTEQWLEEMQNDVAAYPILCRVEKSYAEFPPDPFTKIKKNGSNDETKVTWKAPKDPAVLKEIQGTQMRLALILRPLTPLVPPVLNGGRVYTSLPLPPIFNVVTFPSPQHKPFIIPFSFAYSLTHSLVKEQKVSFKGGKGYVVEFAKLNGDVSSIFDDQKLNSAAELVKRVDKAISVNSFLEQALSGGSKGLAVRDCHVVIETMRNLIRQRSQTSQGSAAAPRVDMMSLIACTLPMWNGVSTAKKADDDKTVWFSPWELSISDGQLRDCTPDGLASKQFDEALRRKVETVIEDFAWDNQEAGDLLYYTVTDEVAPSYSCAVPISMSLERILSRFGDEAESDSKCYYRGIEQIQSDISLILENCLLYNAPDSAIVEAASLIIPQLKELVSKAHQAHVQEVQEARRADEERRKLVLSLSGDTGGLGLSESDSTSARGPMVTTLRQPYEDVIHQNWLQGVQSLEGVWLPQTGDFVQYSPVKHAAFVQGHFPSLEPEQCTTPAFATDGLQENDEWIEGKIMWTRACFPKAPSKKSNDDQITFPTSTTLLAVGVQMSQGRDIFVVYYRPCLLGAAHSLEETCGACSLDSSSFLRPCEPSSDNGQDTTVPVSEESIASIEQCMSFLKKRCMKGEVASALDPLLDKANVRQGYAVKRAKFGLKNIPAFGDLLFADGEASTTKSTRGVKVTVTAPAHDENQIAALADSGFLPGWTKSGTEQLERDKTVTPWPNMSLELVQLRLKKGYYRSRQAISNDIVEAFVSSVITLMFEPVNRKKSPVLGKRVVRMSTKATIEGQSSSDADNTLLGEECELAFRIKQLRDTHAMALVAVTDTTHFERLFGLDRVGVLPPTVSGSQKKGSSAAKDPVREEARQKLALLLEAVGKDQLLNVFGQKFHGERASVPKTKLTIMSEGLPVARAKYYKRVSVTPAELEDGRTLDVRIRANRKTVSWLTELDDDGANDDSDESQLSYNDVRVAVICNGKAMGKNSHKLVAAVPGRLGDKTLVRKVTNSIMLGTKDYEAGEDLVKFIFGRPERMGSCARCQAFRRSLFTCRVRRSHSNVDYDWVEHFENGGGIDGLLVAMDPSYTPPVESGTASSAPDPDNRSDMAEDAKPRTETSNAKKRVSKEDDDDDDDDAQDDDENKDDEDETSDPREQLEKAKKAVELGKFLLKQAKDYAARPVRPSEEFIYSFYPIDPSDNHYIYCIICGLSGDLLCCDGCPNVVHRDCIAMSDIPEGDWYCEECNSSKVPAVTSHDDTVASDVSGGATGKKAKSPGAKRSRKSAPQPANGTSNHDPDKPVALTLGNFERAEFDDSATEKLTSLLVELNDARPERYRSKAKAEDATKNDENEATDEQKRGKHRRISVEDNQPAAKRRARKSSLQHMSSPTSRPAESVVELEASRFGRKRSRTQFLSENTIVGNYYASGGQDSGQSLSPSSRKSKKSAAHLWDDPFDRLNANAQSFLGTVNISTAEEFLATKTSDIADALINWREKQKLPELKGTGAIATISGWKTLCRDAAKEMGMEDLATIEPTKARKQSSSRKSSGAKRSRRVNTSQLPADADSIEALSASAKAFLESVNITTGEAFIDATTTDLAKQLVAWRKSQGMPALKGTGSIATISGWKTQCRTFMESGSNNEQVPSSTAKKPASIPKSNAAVARSPKKRKRVQEPASESDDSDVEGDPRGATEIGGPFERLPEYAQDFLHYKGFITGDDFLESKSSEIARKYVKWRQKTRMTVLKGSGPGAHIGAWKAVVRKWSAKK